MQHSSSELSFNLFRIPRRERRHWYVLRASANAPVNSSAESTIERIRARLLESNFDLVEFEPFLQHSSNMIEPKVRSDLVVVLNQDCFC